jgi:hypothetical protein
VEKTRIAVLTLFFMFTLAVYPLSLAEPATAQSSSNQPNYLAPGVEVVYGGALWEYYPTANVSSTITNMEQQFNIGMGNYTPNQYWDFGLFKFLLISADNQQGVFQVQSGTFSYPGYYDWSNETVIWNYVWENQTWLVNGTKLDFGLTIYTPPAQLSGNPLLTVGAYQAYKMSDFSLTNRTIYKYYQKDNGRLLYIVSFSTGSNVSDFAVLGLSTTSMQTVTVQGKILSVASNSTISALIYNSTAKTLSFSASGLNGSTGYAEIVFSQELCANISDMKVYVDGVQRQFGYTSMDGYWFITVTYNHSTHNIAIAIPEFTPFSLFAGMSVATGALAWFKKKKK